MSRKLWKIRQEFSVSGGITRSMMKPRQSWTMQEQNWKREEPLPGRSLLTPERNWMTDGLR